jgi:pimeloyl-ACP methyl ester carboxylesterase
MPDFREGFFRTDDGRRLFYRDYAGPTSRSPVICIPGLQTNSRSFRRIAPHISKKRRVLCIDPRGRGRSEHDSDPSNYRLNREAADVAQLARHAGISSAVLLGASRGGLSGLLVSANSTFVAGLILVDIGPEIEMAALARLARDVSPNVSFATWSAAAESLKEAHGQWFPSLPGEKWHFWAATIYKEQNGRIVPDSDPRIADRAWEASQAGPNSRLALWPAFKRLPPMPVLVIRGEYSDVLSEQAVSTMRSLRPDLMAVTVSGRGHRPFLDEPESVAALRLFLERVR